MSAINWYYVFIVTGIVLFYHRATLVVWTSCFLLLLIAAIHYAGFTIGLGLSCILFVGVALILNLKRLRYRYISSPLLQFYRKVMPTMSRTEREAISAGTVTWEGDLFRGNPSWRKLLRVPPAKLTVEEQAFIDGPLETLCGMVHDWDITHNRADLPPEVWSYLKEQGFFGLLIPKQYGGKEFSAFAHSQILVKISGISITASTTVAVPNSLGPAELLLHYGTDEQKHYYLPRLARGEEIPCFALTSPDAGSDAGAMTDHGIVCYGEHDGKNVLGIRLNFNKRYITLAPIATVIGLAFKLYDPDHLLGAKEEIGITCALIPRQTPGMTIGRRHFPVNTPFQNGPIHGNDVFIPIDWIIGGPKKAGKGWGMLMECLASGRAITLPASAVGGAKISSYTTGAYARIRKQFNVPISRFEGVEEPLARIAAFTYIMDAARVFVSGFINSGEKPAVASAIVKYHTTELGRKVACDGMDIHGGKGICLGPKNYLGRGYESIPIAITVEGANILTRNMIIFGQGAMRCHPFVFAELEAAKMPNPDDSLKAFDKAVIKHIAFAVSNFTRSLFLGLTGSLLVFAPRGKTKPFFQSMTRFSSVLALLTDVSMLTVGGALKRKESLSARLGDILSYLYLLSAILKQYHDDGAKEEDYPLVRYAAKYCLFKTQERVDAIIKNFPNRWIGLFLRVIIFPLGRHFSLPSDKLSYQVAELITAPTDTRQRLSAGAYIAPQQDNVIADVQDALLKCIAAEPVEKIIRMAKHDDDIAGYTIQELAQAALQEKIITDEQFDLFMQADIARKKVIAVDDFESSDLARTRVDETIISL